MASATLCHTRHLLLRAEAREPEACRTRHGGGEHMQFDAWGQPKHGIRYDLLWQGRSSRREARGAVLPALPHAGGEHAVRTPYSLGFRLPLPEDKAWRSVDRAVLFRALGVLDAAGGPGRRI
jgi:hypothetical protein